MLLNSGGESLHRPRSGKGGRVDLDVDSRFVLHLSSILELTIPVPHPFQDSREQLSTNLIHISCASTYPKSKRRTNQTNLREETALLECQVLAIPFSHIRPRISDTYTRMSGFLAPGTDVRVDFGADL